MGNKILTKAEIEQYKSIYDGSLFVETYHQSRPVYYLKLYTTSGGKTLGRVSGKIFSWFNLVLMKSQPGYINVSWKKFE